MNVSIDIDSFIREQKSKIASERQYLSNPNLSNKKADNNFKIDNRITNSKTKIDNDNENHFVFKMKEGENMKNRYKQELRNDFSNTKELSRHLEQSSSRREKAVENNQSEGLLPGLSYSSSASKRKEQIRNQEYNEFKKADEMNFKNRFNDKKHVSKLDSNISNQSFLQRNPITLSTSDVSGIPPVRSRSPSPADFFPSSNKTYESTLDQLEKKVDELRNFRLKQIDHHQPIDTDYYEHRKNPMIQTRSLEDAERKLREIESKYDSSRSRFLKTQKKSHGFKPRFIPTILDDDFQIDSHFERPSEKQILSASRSIPDVSIVPMGQLDEESVKRRKQNQYRLDLENQIKEKSRKPKHSAEDTQSVSFFDKFQSNQKVNNNNNNNTISNSDNSPRGNQLITDLNNDYFYFASHNPLDDIHIDTHATSYVPSVKPIDPVFQQSNKSSSPGSGVLPKENYAEELKKQIAERKMRKELEKKKEEEYERKKNEEISKYDPFGRSGGGAPLKDNRGEIVTDLKNFQFDQSINRITMPPVIDSGTNRIITSPRLMPDSVRSNIDQSNESKTHARGGHGIFGQALSDEDKLKAERYKEQLRLQIDNNRQQREREREKERLLEQKEREKFERDQKQIQLELENEKRLQQQKERDRLEQLEQLKIQSKTDNQPKVDARMKTGNSRPIESPVRKPSPIVTARRKIVSPPSIDSAPINRDLILNFQSLRNKLSTEMAVIEKELSNQNDHVEVYDPRLAAPKPVPTVPMAVGEKEVYNSNVFQAVLDNKGALSVRRNPLKSRKPSGQSLLNTEADLDEYLRQQESILDRMNRHNFSRFELNMQDMSPGQLGIRPRQSLAHARPHSQSSNQLESDSKFIGFDQSRDFLVKTSLSDVSNNEYRYSHNKSPSHMKLPSEFGSNTTLNLDEITRKNEQRKRKLQKIQSENEKHQSSEEILNDLINFHRD